MSYCARADIESVFGVENVKQWADLDNDEVSTKIAARITAAIAYAQAEVDDRLRGGPYTPPLDEPPPSVITDIAAKLAGVWMYENRGVRDYNPDTGEAEHRLTFQKDDAEKKLREIRVGLRRLDLADRMHAPQVVDLTEYDYYDDEV